jgi:hypothetical protein
MEIRVTVRLAGSHQTNTLKLYRLSTEKCNECCVHPPRAVKKPTTTMPHYLGNMEGVALITGAASGIGRCCAMVSQSRLTLSRCFYRDSSLLQAFAELGTKLVLLDLNMAGLQKLEAELNLPQGHVLLRAIDVRDSEGIADFIASIPSIMGGLHFCINCSGILGPNYNDDIANQPEENWSMVRRVICCKKQFRKYVDSLLVGVLTGPGHQPQSARNHHQGSCQDNAKADTFNIPIRGIGSQTIWFMHSKGRYRQHGQLCFAKSSQLGRITIHSVQARFGRLDEVNRCKLRQERHTL